MYTITQYITNTCMHAYNTHTHTHTHKYQQACAGMKIHTLKRKNMFVVFSLVGD